MGKQKGYVIIVKMAGTPAGHTPSILCGILAARPVGVWIRTEAGTVNQCQDTLQTTQRSFPVTPARRLIPLAHARLSRIPPPLLPVPHLLALALHTPHPTRTVWARSERGTHAGSSVVQASRTHSRVKQVWVQIPGPLLTNSVSLMKPALPLGTSVSLGIKCAKQLLSCRVV